MSSEQVASIPAPGEGKRGEDGHLGYLVRQAQGSIRLAMERALEDLDVTQPQFLVMTMINAYPGSSSADIARLTMLTPQTISVIVSNLEKTGRVERATSVRHGRIQITMLTEAGRDLLGRCRQRTQLIEQSLANGLDAEGERVIRRWLVDVATKDLLSDVRARYATAQAD